MKKWIPVISVIVVLGIAGTGIWFYHKFNKKSELINYIPADVETLIYVNFKQIIRQVVSEKDTGRERRFMQMLKTYAPELENLKNADIDPFGDAAVFYWKGNYYAAMMITDADALNSLLSQNKLGKTRFKVPEPWTFSSSSNGHINWLWNDKVLYVTFTHNQNTLPYISELCQIENRNFINSPFYAKCNNPQSLAWFYSKTHPFSYHFPIKGTIQYHDDLLIEAGDLDEDLSQPLDITCNLDRYPTVFMADSADNQLNQWLELMYIMKHPEGQSKDFFVPPFRQYKKLILFDSAQVVERKFIRYEYDENFEKKEVTVTVQDTLPGLKFYFGTADSLNQDLSLGNRSDRALFKQIPKDLIVYCRFDHNFISKFYTSPLGFLFELKGIETDKGERYQVKLKIDKADKPVK